MSAKLSVECHVRTHVVIKRNVKFNDFQHLPIQIPREMFFLEKSNSGRRSSIWIRELCWKEKNGYKRKKWIRGRRHHTTATNFVLFSLFPWWMWSKVSVFEEISVFFYFYYKNIFLRQKYSCMELRYMYILLTQVTTCHGQVLSHSDLQ